jgi:hypothetical protein
MEFYVLIIAPVMWFGGAALIWHYGSSVRRLRIPMAYCVMGSVLLGIRGLVVVFDYEPDSPWNIPDWLVEASLFMVIPGTIAVISGILYACLNANRIERRVKEEMDAS